MQAVQHCSSQPETHCLKKPPEKSRDGSAVNASGTEGRFIISSHWHTWINPMNQDGSQTPEDQRTDPPLLTPFHRTPNSVFEDAFTSAEPTPCTKPVHIIVRNLTDTSRGTPGPKNKATKQCASSTSSRTASNDTAHVRTSTLMATAASCYGHPTHLHRHAHFVRSLKQ